MSAREKHGSRQGELSENDRNWVSLWTVTVEDNNFNNPTLDAQLPRIGEPHDTYFPGSVVRSIRAVAPLTADGSVWDVAVRYGSPKELLGIGDQSGWQDSFSSGSQTKQIFVERKDSGTKRVIGPYRHFEVEGDDPWFQEAEVVDSQTKKVVTKKLRIIGSNAEGQPTSKSERARNPLGMTIFESVGTYQMQQTFPSTVNLSIALAMKNLINKRKFRIFAAETLMFDSFDVTKIAKADVPGGIAFPVRLSFMYNRRGWKEKHTHVFEGSGGKATVHNKGSNDPIEEEFEGYETFEFQDLIDSF